jgi:SLA1 homology domain 1, SHD1
MMKSSTSLLTTITGLGLCLLGTATLNARIWKDVTGKHEVDAEFISLAGDNVELKTADGRILKLPLAKLSDADRVIANKLANDAASVPVPDAAPSTKDKKQQKIAIDGDVDDWSSIPLVIEAANSPDVKEEVDVQQLKVGSDDENLYIYVTTTLPPLSAIKQEAGGASEAIFAVYLDTDGDTATGCENYAVDLANRKKISGFDLQLEVSVGRNAGSFGALDAKDGPFARYNTFAPRNGSFSFRERKKMVEQYSIHDNPSLAICPMGIELALPLETYQIKPGAKIRLLIHKYGSMKQAVYSEGAYQSTQNK